MCVYVGGGNIIVSSHLHSLYLVMCMNVYAFVFKFVCVCVCASVKGGSVIG